jgi:hypothetical protein
MTFSFVLIQRPPQTTELPTHLRALNPRASKINQDGVSDGFINRYFVYEIFYQEKDNYLV